MNNSIFSTISKRADRNMLYVTSGLAVSSVLFYYFYSNLSDMKLPMSIFSLLNSNSNSNSNNQLTNTASDKATDKDKDKYKSKDVSYENKYYDKFQEMESEDLEEAGVKSLKNSVLYEMTPKGRIVMYYDFENESFIYHCDTKDVPYLYLETVARKYALTYHCKKIVVDIKKELEVARETSIVNEKNNKSKILVGVKADSLFATFKSYNRKGSGGSKTINKKFILRQNANRYSYGGKVSEFPFLKTNDYKLEKPMEKMNYETFKKLMAKKN
jgi:hypothetical protein